MDSSNLLAAMAMVAGPEALALFPRPRPKAVPHKLESLSNRDLAVGDLIEFNEDQERCPYAPPCQPAVTFRVLEIYSLEGAERVRYRPADDGPLLKQFVGPTDILAKDLKPFTKVGTPTPRRAFYVPGVNLLPYNLGSFIVDPTSVSHSSIAVAFLKRANTGVHMPLVAEVAQQVLGAEYLSLGAKYVDKEKLTRKVVTLWLAEESLKADRSAWWAGV